MKLRQTNIPRKFHGLRHWLRRGLPPRDTAAVAGQQRGNRAAAANFDLSRELFGAGGGWANPDYGSYYATSVSVYAAIKLRAEALSRPPVQFFRQTPQGERRPAEPSHPARRLLDQVNPRYTRGDLWRATEIHLSLWGSAFWALEQDPDGGWEIWPLRPDRVRILPHRQGHIRGFVYQGDSGAVAYTPEEMVWIRYFNPLEEFAGLSPLAAARLPVDMGRDGLNFNRNFLRNSAQPDFVLLTNESLTDADVQDFYERWEARYRGPGNAHRPAIANYISDIKTLGLTHREMDFIQGLRWSLEEVSRGLRGAQAPAVGPGAGHLRQHQRRRADILAQHHGAGDAFPGGAVDPPVAAPAGLPRPGLGVRPGQHRGPAGDGKRPGEP